MHLGIIGTSIWQQNMPLLERLTIDREERANRLAELKERLGLEELLYLATCNRVEFLYVVKDRSQSAKILHRLIDAFFRDGRDISFFPNDFFHFKGKEALLHVFRTVASLESLVIGETQIAGQFSDALTFAREHNLVGTVVNEVAEEALLVSRKVRQKTSVGRGVVSMASLAMRALEQRFGRLSKLRIALIGASPMTVKCARHLSANDAEILFVNRTLSKASSLAGEFGGSAISLDQFIQFPSAADAIVSATASSEAVFDASFADRLSSNGQHVVCIDLAIPRDFACDFDAHGSVELIDIPHLRDLERSNLRQKFIESSHADEIIRSRVNRFLSNRIELTLKPIFQESYRESIEMAREAFDHLFEKKIPSLDDKQRDAVFRLVTKVVGHSSFQPVKMLSDRMVESHAFMRDDEIAGMPKVTL